MDVAVETLLGLVRDEWLKLSRRPEHLWIPRHEAVERLLRVHFASFPWAEPARFPVGWATISTVRGAAADYEVTLQWDGRGGWGRRYRCVGERVVLVEDLWIS
ncbi:MAG: hypothetical protein V4850_02750 [Myxococcota bacterium]